MQLASMMQAAAPRRSVYLPWISLIALFSATFVAIGWGPDWVVSWDTIHIAGVTAAFVIAAFATWLWSRRDDLQMRNLSLLLWFFLLGSEGFFPRAGSAVAQAMQSGFSLGAYGEASVWLLVACVLALMVAKNPVSLRGLAIGQRRWLFLFAAVCAASAVYSEAKTFSLGWAFKLCLIVGLLHVCSSLVVDKKDVYRFLYLNLAVMLTIMTIQAIVAVLDTTTLSQRGDIVISPVTIAENAASSCLLALILFRAQRKRWLLLICLATTIVMLLCFGKMAIAATFAAGFFLFLLEKNIKHAIIFGVIFALLAGAAIAFTPAGDYLREYQDQDQASNLSGRTNLWIQAIPAIRERLLIGHGYMTSRFVGWSVRARWGSKNWPGHLHNSALDVLYCNGLMGFFLVFGIGAVTVRNLWRIIRRSADQQLRTLAIGMLSFFLFMFLNSLLEQNIGSRPEALFALFLLLYALSIRFVEMETSAAARIPQIVDIEIAAPAAIPAGRNWQLR